MTNILAVRRIIFLKKLFCLQAMLDIALNNESQKLNFTPMEQ